MALLDSGNFFREDPNLGEIIISKEDISLRVSQLAQQITQDYARRSLLLVGVLKGAFRFLSDLCAEIDLPIEIDFMAVSSYGSATKTSGVVRIVKDLDVDLEGREVMLIEDIVDSGLTLNYLLKNLQTRQPKSLEVCALLVKEGMQKVSPNLRYQGFTIPNEFVIGYGLDANEKYRNLPYIAKYQEPLRDSVEIS